MGTFKSPFFIGQVVSNAELTSKFEVGNMGGMRRSKKNGTLVIVSDHTKGLYDDKWYGDVLHYTGMGKNGDQVFKGNQNKTLAESNTNGVDIHLFEVIEPAKYIYQGIVKLCDQPYQETQKDESGQSRKVWMFPLKVVASDFAITETEFEIYERAQKAKAKSLSRDNLEAKAKESSSEQVSNRKVTSNVFVRNPFVTEYVKLIANGICGLCDQPAPFIDKSGKPFLHSHHVEYLANGGKDVIENCIAVCPNCHARIHALENPKDKQKLLDKISVRG